MEGKHKKIKQRIMNVHIFQLPHGRETWTLNKNMEKRINAFENK